MPELAGRCLGRMARKGQSQRRRTDGTDGSRVVVNDLNSAAKPFAPAPVRDDPPECLGRGSTADLETAASAIAQSLSLAGYSAELRTLSSVSRRFREATAPHRLRYVTPLFDTPADSLPPPSLVAQYASVARVSLPEHANVVSSYLPAVHSLVIEEHVDESDGVELIRSLATRLTSVELLMPVGSEETIQLLVQLAQDYRLREVSLKDVGPVNDPRKDGEAVASLHQLAPLLTKLGLGVGSTDDEWGPMTAVQPAMEEAIQSFQQADAFPKLRELEIEGMRITMDSAESLLAEHDRRLPAIETLRLVACEAETRVVHQVSNFLWAKASQLRELSFEESCDFDPCNIVGAYSLPMLEELNLCETYTPIDYFAELLFSGHMPVLKSIDVSYNDGMTPGAAEMLGESLRKLPNIEHVDLSDTDMSSDVLKIFFDSMRSKQPLKLKRLDLSRNEMLRPAAESLAQLSRSLPELEELDISEMHQLSKNALGELGELGSWPNVRSLSFSDKHLKLTSTAAYRLFGIPHKNSNQHQMKAKAWPALQHITVGPGDEDLRLELSKLSPDLVIELDEEEGSEEDEEEYEEGDSEYEFIDMYDDLEWYSEWGNEWDQDAEDDAPIAIDSGGNMYISGPIS